MITEETSESIVQAAKIRIIGVTLRDKGKMHQCDPQDLYLTPGEYVFIESDNGEVVAQISYTARYVPRVNPGRNLKKVLRRLKPEDLQKMGRHQAIEKEASQYCISRVEERRIDMKLVDVEFMFNESKMVFSFTADDRVDFRELVKDLAYKYRARIEMRQIGVRDGARMINGVGPCGRSLCCSTFLKEFGPVSIKMARDQDLVLNPAKTSGLCGRLKCCIAYEHGMEKPKGEERKRTERPRQPDAGAPKGTP